MIEEKLLLKFMKTKNLSVSSFAKDCGISITTLKKALSGSDQVSLKPSLKFLTQWE